MTIKEPLATDTHAVKADVLTTLTKCPANICCRRHSGLNRYINIDLRGCTPAVHEMPVKKYNDEDAEN